MATKPTVKQNTGIFASLFTGAALVCGFTYYLIQTHQHLGVQALALAPGWVQIKPLWVKQIIAQGGFAGTLGAVLLLMSQGLLYGSAAFIATYFGSRLLRQKPSFGIAAADSKEPQDNGVFSAEIPGSELMVILPKYPGRKKGQWLGGSVDKNPYHQDFYRVDKSPLTIRPGVVLSPHKKLYLSIYAMLKAHSDVPASVGGHHADAPLFEHSQSVSKKVVSFFAERGKREPLAAIAGLAHDLDKLLAYKKKEDSWVKNVDATHHNKYAAYIVSTQPVFHELPEEDRNTLVLALRYYHDPDNLPIGASSRIEALILALRMCDGYAIQEEKAAGIDSLTEEHIEAIDKALLDTISELNINCYLSKNDHAGGWTTPALEYVITPMSTVLEQMGKHLSVDLNRKLQLDHETRNFKHPAAELVRDRLDRFALLMKSYKSFTSDSGLYDCRIGSSRFRAVLMLQKSVLDNLLPGLSAKWDTSIYRIRITSATDDNSTQGDSDVEETQETAKEA